MKLLGNVRNPRLKSIIRKLFFFLYGVGIFIMIIPFSISQPSPIFREILDIREKTNAIGFLENPSESGYMKFSAQYWLAPVVLVQTDPFCCQYLITNDLSRVTKDYISIEEFYAGWFLVEFK